MIVTEIRELNAKKVLVTIDGHLVFPLYKNELRQYGLREEAEVDPACWSELWDVTLVKRSRLRAMNLLQKKNYTKAELERKLKGNYYPQELIDQALLYVMKFHYIDDYRYAEDYIRYHSIDRSRQRIRCDLLTKGVSDEVFASAWEHFQADNEDWDEKAQIERLLQKKKYDPEHADVKERARMLAFLFGKGYSAEAIFSCLDASRRR